MKARIVKRTNVDGNVEFVIQQKHWLFRWWWVVASMNSGFMARRDSFDTLEEAENNLCYFDGSVRKDVVVQ